MGNGSSSGLDKDHLRNEWTGPEKRNTLDDLPKNFSCHYNSVMSLVEATIAHQKLVDELCIISKDDSLDQETKLANLKKGGYILEKLQASCYIQTTPIQDNLMNLYQNIQAILLFFDMKAFEIDSPFLQSSMEVQDWIRYRAVRQHQAVDGNLVPTELKEKMQKEITMLNMKLLKHQDHELKLEESYAKVCLKVTELTKSMDALNKDLKHKTSLNDFLKGENEKLSKIIEDLQPPKISGSIQLYHSHSGNTIKDIETELKRLLANQLNDVDIIKCNTLSDVDNSKMLIVLSIIASRVGTDAANAIKDVRCPRNTALLLFHIKESHALSKQASTAVLTDKSFKELGGIFDMAFAYGKGIYQCEMNDDAIKGVCDFIERGILGIGI